MSRRAMHHRGRVHRSYGIANFSPAKLPGLALWLDPADSVNGYVLTLGRVSQLNDKSGNGRHYTQGTAANRPVINAAGINGRDTVLFNSANQEHLIGPSLSALVDGAHFFIVTKLNAGTGGGPNGLCWFGSPVDAGYYPYIADRNVYDSIGSTTRRALGQTVGNAFLETTRCYETVTTSAEYTSYFDGAQFFTTPTNTVGWNASLSYLGRNGSTGTTYYPGQVAELIAYDHKLSTASHRSAIKSYLSARWGLVFA